MGKEHALSTTGKKLDSGDRFPAVKIPLVGGETVELPIWFSGRWSILLLYRGDW